MKLNAILSEVEQIQTGRRVVLERLGKAGAKAALAALPVGLGSVFAANAAPTALTVAEALQFALKLARLQYEFYTKALDANAPALPFPTPLVRAAVTDLQRHEEAHVNRLMDMLTGMGESPEPKPDFDFTLNNQFAAVFSAYSDFLIVAQTLEDGTVRALKGYLAEFFDNKTLLKTMLALHGTQARHAGFVRNLRRQNGDAGSAPWITEAETHNAPALVYAGEANTQQEGTDVAALPAGTGTVGTVAATQAFNEPFSAAEAQAFLALFLA